MDRYKLDQKSVIKDTDADIDGDDEDDDDNVDDDDTHDGEGRHGNGNGKSTDAISTRENNDEECVRFIQNILERRRKARSNDTSDEQDSLARHGILPSRSTRGRKRNVMLRSRPKIQGEIQNFLALTDRRLKGLASVALRKSQSQDKRQANALNPLTGGLVMTRAANAKKRRLENEGNGVSLANVEGSGHSSTATPRRRKTSNGNKKADTNKNKQHSTKNMANHSQTFNGNKKDDTNKTPGRRPTSDFPARNHAMDKGDQEEEDLALAEQSTLIPFRPGCLLFLDDVFVAQTSLRHRNSNTADANSRTDDKNQFLDAVGLASQISLELSHHLKVRFYGISGILPTHMVLCYFEH